MYTGDMNINMIYVQHNTHHMDTMHGKLQVYGSRKLCNIESKNQHDVVELSVGSTSSIASLRRRVLQYCVAFLNIKELAEKFLMVPVGKGMFACIRRSTYKYMYVYVNMISEKNGE
jgi:hypothetical protein